MKHAEKERKQQWKMMKQREKKQWNMMKNREKTMKLYENRETTMNNDE